MYDWLCIYMFTSELGWMWWCILYICCILATCMCVWHLFFCVVVWIDLMSVWLAVYIYMWRNLVSTHMRLVPAWKGCRLDRLHLGGMLIPNIRWPWVLFYECCVFIWTWVIIWPIVVCVVLYYEFSFVVRCICVCVYGNVLTISMCVYFY